MKRIFYFISCLIIVSFSVVAQKVEPVECVQCSEPQVPHGEMGEYSSILGFENLADGYSSIAGGALSRASGNFSIVLGWESSASDLNTIALGNNALAQNQDDIAIGKYVTCNSGFEAMAMAFGKFLYNNGANSLILGKGWNGSDRLENSIDNCMLVGFNSKVPTLYVGPNTSISDPYLSGKVGIGNQTDPQAKLHIKADIGEAADLFIEPNEEGNRDTAKLYLGTLNHRLEGKVGQDLSFFTGHNFIFSNGFVGIGTPSPQSELDVNGGIHSLNLETDNIAADHISCATIEGGTFTLDEISVLNNNNDWAATIENLHSEGKGLLVKAGTYTYSNPVFEVQDKDGNSVLFTMANQGKVGIGTTSPQSKLDVAGTVRMTGLNLPTNAVDGYVLTSNSTGIASWIDPTLSYYWQKNATGDLYYSDQGHKVGINTNNPSYTLDVEGNLGVKDNLTGKSSSSYDALYLSGSELSSSAKIEIGRGVNKKGIKIICPDPAGDIQMHFNSIPAVFIQSDAANFGSTNHEMDLNVNGKIQATEVEVMINIWQDQVFENNYPLMDLNSLERFINENHHLPEIPSEEEVISNGINVGEMNALLLKKIEELTLYVIDLKKENDLIKTKLESLMQEE